MSHFSFRMGRCDMSRHAFYQAMTANWNIKQFFHALGSPLCRQCSLTLRLVRQIQVKDSTDYVRAWTANNISLQAHLNMCKGSSFILHKHKLEYSKAFASALTYVLKINQVLYGRQNKSFILITVQTVKLKLISPALCQNPESDL